MGHEQSDIRQYTDGKQMQVKARNANNDDFVLDKVIFSKVFEKDIRRVFIYKKAERIAKALHLITPAFIGSVSLKNRVDTLALALIDAATMPPSSVLSRELLALSSVLSIAKTSGLLSSMNADFINREVQTLLHEVANYEEPRLTLEEVPTLSSIAKTMSSKVSESVSEYHAVKEVRPVRTEGKKKEVQVSRTNRNVKDTEKIKDRRDSILSVIRTKHEASIKDISTLIRGVSEKTIQRELATLIVEGIIKKKGERRWSTYSLA